MLKEKSTPFTKHCVARFAKPFSLAVLLTLSLIPADGAHINTSETFELSGTVRPDLPRHDLGVEEPGTIHSLTLILQGGEAKKKGLEEYLQQQRRSESPHWLTPRQFGERFGPDAVQVSAITAWLEEQGFSAVQVNDARTRISMQGSSGVIASAFQTAIHKFGAAGLTFSNVSDPVLPKGLKGAVAGILGMHNVRLRSRVVTGGARVTPRFSSATLATHALVPGDLATAYNFRVLHSKGFTGQGQTIAIAGQSDINVAAVRAFRTAAGLPFLDPVIVLAGSDPGTNSEGELEGEMNVEWTGAVAPGATITYVNSADAFTSATYAVDHQLAPVLLITYGACESSFAASEIAAFEATLAQGNAQGMTIVVPSGDSAAADCYDQASAAHSTQLAVEYPASSQYVTAVGGTALSNGSGYWNSTNDTTGSSAVGYVPETAWNDTAFPNLEGSGGGPSSLFAKPTWQTGVGVPQDPHRAVPDLAMAASPNATPYLVCSGTSDCSTGFADNQGKVHEVGGTSSSATVVAGFVAIVDQQYGNQGNINSRLYTLASISPDAFHDITQGNNFVPCDPSSVSCINGQIGYQAGVGYDEVTGLGSVNGGALFDEWQSDFNLSAPNSSVTLAAGTSTTENIQIVGKSGFQGTVILQCTVSSVLAGTSCSTTGSVTGNGTLPVTLTRPASSNTAPSTFIIPPGSWLLASFCAVFGFWLLVKERSSLAAVLASACLLLSSCGGGSGSSVSPVNSSPVNVTGTVTVTARSGTLSHSIALTVTQ